jgi:hypothetical protein
MKAGINVARLFDEYTNWKGEAIWIWKEKHPQWEDK